MNALLITSLSHKISWRLCARVILGLSFVGAVLLVGAGSVALLQLDPTSTAGGFLSPVMPMVPFVTVFLLNIQP